MAEIEIRVQVDDLTIDDLEALSGELGTRALLDVLDRAVVGGVRGRGIPLRQVRDIAQQISAALLADTKN